MRATRRSLAAAFVATIVALGAGLATATGARVEPPSVAAPIDLRYAMTYAGLQVANLALTMRPANDSAQSELVIEGQGLATLFGRSVTHMSARSRLAEVAAPQQFDARYEKPDRTRETVVKWDNDGRVVSAVEVKEGRPRPSEVPTAQQSNTIDPLTAVLRLRDWLAAPANRVGATTTVAVFDGRKRYDLEVRRLSDSGSGPDAQPRVEARMVPIFGFDADDKFVSWPNQPPHWFEVLVSGDGRFAPLSIGDAGQPVLFATEDCSDRAGCRPIHTR